MDYTQVLVADTRTTMWEQSSDKPVGERVEIICIDLALIDTEKQEIIEREKLIIKPVKSTISRYCQDWNKISQKMVDDHGISFEEAYRRLRVHFMSQDRFWATWGSSAMFNINSECRSRKLEGLNVYPCMDINHLFTLFSGKIIDGRPPHIADAFKHCAMDNVDSNNAVNIARIMLRMGWGCKPAFFSKKR